MIERYKSEDAFSALEDLLLVPVPINETNIPGGFAGQVIKKFPLVDIRLKERGGLEETEILIVGHLGREERWVPAYSLALCGIHRQQERGWESAAEYLKAGLDKLVDRTSSDRKLATAGIPGTGYSGLSGNASPEDIKNVLDQHSMRVTVYQDSFAGDREELTYADPPLDAKVSLPLR